MDWNKVNRAPYWAATIKDLMCTSPGCWKRRERGRVEKYFMEVMAENISHFARELNLQIQ